MKVLLIDDDDDIRRIGEFSLSRVGGFEVAAAASAPEGITAAHEAPPDVILMDMMMPGMDGLEALRCLLESPDTCDIPVIFMTAKVQPSEVRRYLESGARGVIAKPFDPMTLADEVLRLLAAATKR